MVYQKAPGVQKDNESTEKTKKILIIVGSIILGLAVLSGVSYGVYYLVSKK
jgi:hypothetical protein